MADEKVLLRFYLRSGDHPPLASTYERIVKAAGAQHMAGATVLKGILGYGSRGLLHESVWTLAEHLPVIVEIVDSSERVLHFLDELNRQRIVGGLATLRGEVLAEARGFIVGDVFAGEFGAENGGRGGGGLGRLPGGGEGCKGMVGLAGAREDAGVNSGVVLRLRVGVDRRRGE